jgi:hypothetical protein
VGYGDTTDSQGETSVSEDRGHNWDTERAPDADLAVVVDCWADMPADVRKMIVGVVRATIRAGRGER